MLDRRLHKNRCLSARGLPHGHGGARVPDTARLLEAMRLSEPVGAGQPRGLPPAIICPPTWDEAGIRLCVQQSVEALVQPRLDSFAQRLASMVAIAQDELRDLDGLVGRAEERSEARLAQLESSIGQLNEASQRAERRERELNMRVASVAASILREVEPSRTDAPDPCGDEALRIAKDASSRVDALDDLCKRGNKTSRRLDERLEDLEERFRAQSRGNSWTLADPAGSARGQITAPQAQLGAEAVKQRLTILEERLCTLAQAATPAAAGVSDNMCRLEELESRSDSQRSDLELVALKVADHSRDLAVLKPLVIENQSTQQDENARDSDGQAAEKLRTVTTRVDDLHHRVGALKVKFDGLEGRLGFNAERFETSRRQLEVDVRQQLTERCDKMADDVDVRVARLQHRVDAFEELAEDASERKFLHAVAGPRCLAPG